MKNKEWMQRSEISLKDVRWVYAPEPHETQGCALKDIIGNAIIQWIHTGEIWLITDGKQPLMACHVTSVMTATELVGVRTKVIPNKTIGELEKRISEGLVITRFEVLCFKAETSDASFILALKSQQEARKLAIRSFDIVLIAMKEIGLMSFVDIGEKADQLFAGIEGASREEVMNRYMKVAELSDSWCMGFDGKKYADRFRQRTKKPIVLPTEWDNL